MIPLFSTSQLREIDDFAINKIGIPGIVLMENAAKEIYTHLEEKILSAGKFRNIGLVCGKGNNGGDGFAVARHSLNNGCQIKIVHLGDEEELSPDCRINYTIIKNEIYLVRIHNYFNLYNYRCFVIVGNIGAIIHTNKTRTRQ